MRAYRYLQGVLVCSAAILATPAAAQDHIQTRAATVLTAAYMSLLAYGDRNNPGSYDECWDGRDPVVLQDLIRKHFDVNDAKWTRIMRQTDDNVQAFIFAGDRRVVVAFRGSCGKDDGFGGTNNSANWRMNYNGLPLLGPAAGFEGVWAHPGWAGALARGVNGSKTYYDDLADWVRQALADAGAEELLITGHSMGGAMAQYFTYRFLQDRNTAVPAPLEGVGQRYVRTNVITFGAPRAGYCGAASTQLPDKFTEQNARKGVFALQIEAQGDPIPLSTAKPANCPRALGNVETFSGFTSDQHDIRNYIKDAHDRYFVSAWGDPIVATPGSTPLSGMIADRKIPFASINIGWVPISGKARQVAIGVNGGLWALGVQALGSDFEIYQAGTSGWEKRPGAAVRIAVDANNLAWVVNSGGDVFQWSASGWQPRGADARDIGIGPDGTVWSISAAPAASGSANGALRVWSPITLAWQAVPNSSGVRVAGGNARTAWVVNAAGQLAQVTMDGVRTDVISPQVSAVAAGGIGVCVLFVPSVVPGGGGGMISFGPGTDRVISCRTKNGWDRLPGAAVELAVGLYGRVYAVNANGDIALSR